MVQTPKLLVVNFIILFHGPIKALHVLFAKGHEFRLRLVGSKMSPEDVVVWALKVTP